MKSKRSITVIRALTLFAVFAPMLCHAHPGHSGHEGDIGWGLLHPLTGIDHLLAALAAGMLAALGRRASLATTFLSAGIVGGLAGAIIGTFAGLETMLAISVLALGLALAFHRRIPQTAVLAMVAMGAAAHGWAHGAESQSAMAVAGVFMATAGLVVTGAVGALAMRRSPRAIAGIGAGIATAAFAILASVL